MNKIPFKHESNEFSISIGITDEEKKAIGDTMLEYLTDGFDEFKKTMGTKEETEPQKFSMSTTLEHVIKKITFPLKAQHYVLMGMMLEKTLESMERSVVVSHIDDMIKELKLEMKTEEQRDSIKN